MSLKERDKFCSVWQCNVRNRYFATHVPSLETMQSLAMGNVEAKPLLTKELVPQ